MPVRKVRILPNSRKGWAVKLAKKLASFLRGHGIAVAHRGVGATICIGGDGTIFYANHKNRISGPVLGIGSRTSVVCQLRKDNWKSRLLQLLRGRVEKRQKLSVIAPGRKITAINDVVVHTHDYRIIRIFISTGRGRSNGGKKYVFDGDGVIVSTATGSTGYAYSAGGRVMAAGSKKLQVVPICPYMRSVSPVIVDENAEITISADRSSDLIVDGIHIVRLRPKKVISVRIGQMVAFLRQ